MSSHDGSEALSCARELSRALEQGIDPSDVPGLTERVDALFAEHHRVVYALCLRSVGDRQLALEVAQDALMRAYQKLPGFRGEGSFRSWLLGVARFECVNAIRKRRDLLTDDGVLELADPAGTALAALRRAEREELLRRAAEAVLEPVEQEAISLRYVEHLPVDRITELLGLTEASGARGLLQRCRRKLGRELRRRLDELGHGSSFVRDSR